MGHLATINGALVNGVEYSPTALQLPSGMSFEQWSALGQSLMQIGKAWQWWVGDWINYGERVYGETYAQAIEVTGKEYQTLADAAWVANQFEFSFRNENLSWSHHRLVAPLDPEDRKKWLDKCEEEGLSKGDLRKRLNDTKMARLREESASTGETQPSRVWLSSWDKWLPSQPECDLLITDPPYATDVEDVAAFAMDWLPVALAKVKKTGRAYVFTGAYPHELEAYLVAAHQSSIPLRQVLSWSYTNTMGPKPRDDYFLNWQAIFYFRSDDAPPLQCEILNDQMAAQTIAHPGRTGESRHTWQKPIEFAKTLISHATNTGDIVLDPFVCTGTFVLAASDLGRVGRGCDISANNLLIAEERGCHRET